MNVNRLQDMHVLLYNDSISDEEIVRLAKDLTHEELEVITRQVIKDVIKCPGLEDVSAEITIEELDEMIAVEYGQSITIYIEREALPVAKVVIPHTATVSKLRKAIARQITRDHKKSGSSMKISWKYIWKTYNLEYDGVILDDLNSNISDYGVTNKVKLKFKKKRKK